MAFHRRCGKRITLANSNRTAMRNISEFNHGLVLSAEPLHDDVLFEVRIDEKVIICLLIKKFFVADEDSTLLGRFMLGAAVSK
jgi:hypothetical protein